MVSHLIRHCVLSMLKDSVCVSPRPDHEPMGLQPIWTRWDSARGAEWHPQVAAPVKRKKETTMLRDFAVKHVPVTLLV